MSTFNAADLVYLVPMLILMGTGILLVLAEAFYSEGPDRADRASLGTLAAAGGIAAMIAAIVLYRQLPSGTELPLVSGMLVADRTGLAMTALLCGLTAAVALMSPGHQREHGWQSGEYYGILLLIASGMVMIAQAGNLAIIVLGIETMSIGVYVLTALRRRSRRGNEAAMKYFLAGAFATGFLLYGMALVYGAAGTTSLAKLPAALGSTTNPGLVVAGVLMMVVAFGFKVAAVPFHMWAPDAYEGAPTPVTALMAAGVKTAAVVAMIRVFGGGLGGDVLPYGTLGWASPMVVLAGITITVGNLAAVRQDNIKRMLAYSSISHGGILLVGIAAMGLGADSARGAVLYYLVAYSITTVVGFAAIAYVGTRGRERLAVGDWAGLASSKPGAALAMTIALLSFGGMPPTGGFVAKFYIFKSAMDVYDGQLLWLVVVGIVNSAISIYYYLKVVTAMYFREPTGPIATTRDPGLTFLMAVGAVLILWLGVMPGFWIGLGT
ncbi:MAG: NADH-quinone oxidoreductase subunit N [Kofleriaceae bacterium]